MKINNAGAKPTSAGQLKARELEKELKTNSKTEAGKASATLGSSKVKMSPEAQSFQKAKAIASQDTIDEAKVARLQKLIDEGKYKVDAEAVADRLVNEHLLSGE